MCGISGILHENGAHDIADQIRAMNSVQVHRGPDDAGIWLGGQGSLRIGLGCTRLKVIDLSEQGHMPMLSSDRNFVITYNGEVYNFREIRQELADCGYEFRSTSDTEVILNAYRHWGPKCLHRLNGMFALAIWNETDQSLFLARDRLGVKPMYYNFSNGRIAFASELKALRQIGVQATIDWEALDIFFAFRVIPNPFTIYKDFRKLPPGHYLVFQNGLHTIQQYWDVTGPVGVAPNDSNENLCAAAIREKLFALVEDAVRLRMVSDVPIGLLLSGGIDSGIVASLMAQYSSKPVKTFTIGFPDSKESGSIYDESKNAQATANFIGSNHRHLSLNAQEVIDSIPTVLDHCDEPFATSALIPAYLVSRLAREDVTVALSGDGPDEIFAGYRAYLLKSLAEIYTALPAALRRSVIEPALFSWNSSDTTTLRRQIRRAQRFLLSMKFNETDRFFHLTNKFLDVMPESVYSNERIFSAEAAKQLFRSYYENAHFATDPINRMLYVDTKIKLVDHILMKVDLMSMKNSLEVRTPFLDYRIVELAFRLPGAMKLKYFQKKRLLKKTFRRILPQHLFHKPKRGFEVPVGRWFKKELRDLFWDTVAAPQTGGGILNDSLIEQLYREHCAERRDHSDKLWMIFTLRWWSKRNGFTL
jgi:asparagine synthase (glutamine-hydrolysing)